MAIIEIPTRVDIARYKYSIILEDVTYFFEFNFNARSERWSMNIFDSDNNLLLAGISLLYNVDLTGRFVNEELPPGRFILYDTEDANKSPTRNELGTRVKLLYNEAS